MVIGKPLFTVEQIQKRVKELADRISHEYEGKELLVVPLLKGAFMFASDLVREIRVPLRIDFVSTSSYLETDTTGQVTLHWGLREKVTGKDVLLVEDIADTGITLDFMRNRLLEEKPRSLRICAFLDKKERRLKDVPLDYVGFEIPNEYVVGYGLDYDDKFRNLPYIAIFKKKA
jgi:hypoxanthine phosphoribosyltransferase